MTRTKKSRQIQKILIIRFSSIGDLVLISHFIRNFHQQYPSCDIHLVIRSEFKSLYVFHPVVRKIWCFEKGDLKKLIGNFRKENYDIIFDLQGNLKSRFISAFCTSVPVFRTHMHRLRRFLLVRYKLNTYKNIEPVPLRHLKIAQKFDVKDDQSGLELFVAKNIIESIESRIPTSPFVVLAPGASRNTKRWPVDKYIEISYYLQDKGIQVVLLGGESDRPICREIEEFKRSGGITNLAGKLSLIQTAAVLKKSSLLISNDTGVMHMGTALQIPVIAIFGPTTQEFGFYPFRGKTQVVENATLKCRPCSFHGTDECPKKHFKCMKDILPTDVKQHIERFLIKDQA